MCRAHIHHLFTRGIALWVVLLVSGSCLASPRQYNVDSLLHVLDAVIDSYLDLYGQKYINMMKIPYSYSSLENLDYDYIEYAEVLNDFVSGKRSR